MKSTWMAVLGSLALLAGCGGGQGSSSASSSTGLEFGANGKLTVLLKDAPAASLKAAVVTITEIDLVGTSGPVVLSTATTTTDLLKLSVDTATLVGSTVVPAGTYTQLRFVITGGYVETTGGELYASSPTYQGLPSGAVVTGTLRMPSFAQSGLKIDLPSGVVLAGEEKIVLVDFDVSQSFGHEAGNSGAWVMHPVCKATDVVVTGSLHVTLALAPGVVLPTGVTLAGFDAVITPVAGGDTLAAALADEGGGEFGVVFPYLAPGDWSISFTPPAAVATFTTDPGIPATATVSSGKETGAAFLLTAASGTPAPPPPAAAR